MLSAGKDLIAAVLLMWKTNSFILLTAAAICICGNAAASASTTQKQKLLSLRQQAIKLHRDGDQKGAIKIFQSLADQDVADQFSQWLVADSRLCLADIYIGQNDRESALRQLDKASKYIEEKGGKNAARLAIVHLKAGDNCSPGSDAQLAHYKEALRIMELSLSKNNRALGGLLQRLASAVPMNSPLAVEYNGRVYENRKHREGFFGNTNSAGTAVKYGVVLILHDQAKAAVAPLEDAVTAATSTRGLYSGDSIMANAILAVCLDKQGLHSEAKKKLDKVWSICRNTNFEDPLQYARLHELGHLLAELKMYDEQKRLVKEALAASGRISNKDHPFIAIACKSLGDQAAARQDLDTARKFWKIAEQSKSKQAQTK